MSKIHNLYNEKWVTFGGSYAGTLSAWIRFKHPELVYASVASSAPLLAKLDFQEYQEVRLGSVGGPVIQATGRSEFEDGLGRVTLYRATHIT
jgi:hypothetical protein